MKASTVRAPMRRVVYEQRYFTPDDIGCNQLFVPISSGVIYTGVSFFVEGEVQVTVQAQELFGGDGASGTALWLLYCNENDQPLAFTDGVEVLPAGSFCGTAPTWGAASFSFARTAGVARRIQFGMSNDFPAADDALVVMKMFVRGHGLVRGVRFAA